MIKIELTGEEAARLLAMCIKAIASETEILDLFKDDIPYAERKRESIEKMWNIKHKIRESIIEQVSSGVGKNE